MNLLRYTLLADGTSDRCLTYVVDWLLKQIPKIAHLGIVPQVADINAFPTKPRNTSERVELAIRQFPCELLFIHRDAEAQPPHFRRQEIEEMTAGIRMPTHVAIVPVRMTEAWLLLEEKAIRTAADNPNGRAVLRIPKHAEWEHIPDPKALLESLLTFASEKTGRRLDQFKRNISQRRMRVAEMITDFTPLRQLSAFASLESDLRVAIDTCLQALAEEA